MKKIQIQENGIGIIASYDKYKQHKTYEIFFNSQSGLEIIRGINGFRDPEVLNMPALLDIGIMGHCKNKCEICYQDSIYEEHMSLENFKTIIDQTKDELNQVALGGRGDPNHHPQFKEILEYCRENNIVPNYTTSGIGLTDEQVEISKLCGAVAVSDYEKSFTYEAIKKFQDAEITTNIHLVLSKLTYEKSMLILNGVDFWNEKVDLKNLNALIFLLFKPVGKGYDKKSLVLSQEKLDNFFTLLFAEKCNITIGMDSCLVNKAKNIPKKFHQFLSTCEGAKQSGYIGPSMKMTPCSFLNNSVGIPIKKLQPICDIWVRSYLFKNFRDCLLEEKDICQI